MNRKTATKAAPSSTRSRTKRPARPVERITAAALNARFETVFAEYWGAIRDQQAATAARTQKAYAGLLQTLQETWEQDAARSRFCEACRRLGGALREIEDGEANSEALEAAYRQYGEELREAWAEPEFQHAIEESYLAFNEEVQRAAEEAQRTLEEARKRYLERLRMAWREAGPATVDDAGLSVISRNAMVTVLFTEGLRPAEQTDQGGTAVPAWGDS